MLHRLVSLVAIAAAATWGSGAALAQTSQTKKSDQPEIQPAPGGNSQGMHPASPGPAQPPPQGTSVPKNTVTKPGQYGVATWPTQLIVRPLTMARGMLQASLHLETSLSQNAIFDPTSLAPDIYYGLTRRLTLSVTHSAWSRSLIGAGDGICMSGKASGCPVGYENLGVDARYGLTFGPLTVAPHLGALFPRMSPFELSVRGGVIARWNLGRVALVTDPWVSVALTNRKTNFDILNIPIYAQIQVTDRFAVWAGSGLNANLSNPQDLLLVPLEVGGLYAVTRRFDVGARFGFPGIGGSDMATTDTRVFDLWVTYRFALMGG